MRTAAIHEARAKFASGSISAKELSKVEDTEIRGLVQKEEHVGLKTVTDGEYRRSFWHMDFLWGLTGTQKVKSEHFSVAFKGFQPKAETVRIVDKLDFPEDHPFLKHFRFLKSITADGIQPKQCIPSPSMLHLICCIRETNYQPIERYKDSMPQAVAISSWMIPPGASSALPRNAKPMPSAASMSMRSDANMSTYSTRCWKQNLKI